MPKMLFVADFPNVIFGERQELSARLVNDIHAFEAGCSTIPMSGAGLARLARNVWLLDAKNSWPALPKLAQFAVASNLLYSIHLIADDGVTQMTEQPTD